MNQSKAVAYIAGIVLAVLLFNTKVSAQFGASPWTSPNGTYTIPAGVTSITVECRGGGGGGGGAKSSSGGDAAGGGGGGGAYSTTTVSVTPGQTITVSIGAGGTQGSNNGGTGGNGGTSSVTYNSSVVASASGGMGGVGGTSGAKAGGAGASTGTGTVRFGGNGGNGFIGGSFDFGGGGGGGAGTTTNGGPGTTSTGAPVAPAPGGSGGTTGGGNGGNGYQGLGGSGAAGSAPGGGGGGAAGYNGASGSGGLGGAGRVVITYTTCVPTTPGSISGTSTICSGTSNTYSVAPVSGATSYTWSLPSGWSGTSTTETITTTASLNGGTISVTADNGCGSSSAQTLLVTVNAIPATPGSITGLTAVCSGSTNTFSVSPVSGATSYTWTLPNGWTGSSSTLSINATANASAGTLSVTANNTCGNSTAQTLAVSVNSTPATPVAISGTDTICNGSTNAYSVVAVNGATSYTWTLPSGWSGVSNTENINTTAASVGGTISVTANNTCGNSTPQALPVSVNTSPAIPGSISGNAAVCDGSANDYSVLAVNGATSYTWSLPNGWSGTSSSDTINATANSTGGNISVTANNTCGNSAAQTLAVSVTALPSNPGAISGLDTICNGNTTIYSVVAVNGAISYTWTLPNGWSGTSATETISTTVNSTVGTVSVTADNTCGSSSAATLDVAVNSVPTTPAVINGDDTVCSGTSNSYSVSAVAEANSYIWTLPNGWSGTSATETINTTSNSTGGNILVTADNGCGSSSAATLVVSVISIPATPVAINGLDSICAGSTNVFDITAVSDATGYTWILPNGWSGTSLTESISATADASNGNISVSADNSCGSSTAQTLSVTVNPLPVVTFDVSPNYVCSNLNPVLALNSGTPAGGTYSGQGVSGNSFDASTLNPASYVLTYTAANSFGCVAGDTATVVVDICDAIPSTIEAYISIYPNPFQNTVTVYTGSDYAQINAVLFDAAGRVVKQVQPEAGVSLFEINTLELSSGYYTLSIFGNGQLIGNKKLFRAE